MRIDLLDFDYQRSEHIKDDSFQQSPCGKHVSDQEDSEDFTREEKKSMNLLLQRTNKISKTINPFS